jgi:hypothetical protein
MVTITVDVKDSLKERLGTVPRDIYSRPSYWIPHASPCPPSDQSSSLEDLVLVTCNRLFGVNHAVGTQVLYKCILGYNVMVWFELEFYSLVSVTYTEGDIEM